MPVTSQQIASFLLAQLVAESYLNGVVGGSPQILTRRLRLGANNFTFTGDTDAASKVVILPSPTRLTEAQVEEFNTRYEVRHHKANTITRFSATLLWDKIDNRYVLSFRSTEYANEDKGVLGSVMV